MPRAVPRTRARQRIRRCRATSSFFLLGMRERTTTTSSFRSGRTKNTRYVASRRAAPSSVTESARAQRTIRGGCGDERHGKLVVDVADAVAIGGDVFDPVLHLP